MHILQGVLIRRVYKRRARGFFRWCGQIERLREVKEKRSTAVGTQDSMEEIEKYDKEVVKKKLKLDVRGYEREVQSIRKIQQI